MNSVILVLTVCCVCCRWNLIVTMPIILVDFVETSMVFLSTMSSFMKVRYSL